MIPPHRRVSSWSDALELLNQAEKLHRQLFAPRAIGLRRPAWEPPVDVVETEREVLIYAALPGADPARIEAHIESGFLVLIGERVLPKEYRDALIHRLELPQGLFQRRVALPPGRYQTAELANLNNCVVVRLTKAT